MFANLEAEQMLLGAVLMNNGAFWSANAIVEERDFSEPAHAFLWRRASDAIIAGKGCSPVTLARAFGEKDPLEEVGGAKAYLAKLASAAVSAFSSRQYAEEVRDCAIRRRLSEVADVLQSSLANSDLRCEEAVASTEAAIHDAVRQGASASAALSLDSVAQMVVAEANTDRPRGIGSGLRAWDHVNGLMMPGDLIVVGGATSAGKTALVQGVVYHAARSFKSDSNNRRLDGARSLFFSMEMSREQYAYRHLSQAVSLPVERIENGGLHPDELEALRLAAAEFEGLPVTIADERGLTVQRMRSLARRHQHMHGLDLIAIDHLGFIAPPERNMPQVQRLEENVSLIKAMALELGVPVILISHLNRGLWQRDDKRPQLSDLHGSSAIEKDADVVTFVHREEYWLGRAEPKGASDGDYADWEKEISKTRGKAEIINGKRRRGRANMIASCAFDAEATRFRDLDPQEQTWSHWL